MIRDWLKSHEKACRARMYSAASQSGCSRVDGCPGCIRNFLTGSGKLALMANRSALITQADATRLFKAAKLAGYDRAKFVSYPDGRVEVQVETTRRGAQSGDDASEWDDVLS
ncbi:hypothetical protein [Mesorhizobium sp. M0195]|uniref:hypothetical protein n=1 Tax=Mesorhizobium sp. M0195 TaxID=2956910 RepID=UPI003337BE40